MVGTFGMTEALVAERQQELHRTAAGLRLTRAARRARARARVPRGQSAATGVGVLWARNRRSRQAPTSVSCPPATA